ncbi:cytochrome c oxidase assembly protein [Bacillus solimangrovi]|uniref:Cytochrome c oxidase assembly protein n=2 Tax=Bacillus solimangrovi TaxID=1305675 RepID=A0A1E5LJJ6_9BACI|nr:cytochrome c oxidase assembly protein [Bacillus solimangrovi]
MLFVLLLITILSACSNSEKTLEEPNNWKVEDFTYTNQANNPVSLEDLKGTVWLADFIFTNCDTVCPPMTANMNKLQVKLKEEGMEDVRIVSFSVDPEVDTPQMLQEFGDKFGVDYSNWDFLTGYKLDEVKTLALKSFKALVEKPEGEDQVWHGTSFYLVNQEGIVVRDYSGLDVPFEQIIADIKTIR